MASEQPPAAVSLLKSRDLLWSVSNEDPDHWSDELLPAFARNALGMDIREPSTTDRNHLDDRFTYLLSVCPLLHVARFFHLKSLIFED